MSETLSEELSRRAQRLIDKEGVWVDETQRELLVTGWSTYAIIIVEYQGFLAVHYDTPVPSLLCSDDPRDDPYKAVFGEREHLTAVVEALRRRMVLEDLADV